MKTPFAELSPHDQILELDPEARFARGALPGRPTADIVLLSPLVRSMDLPAIGQIARSVDLIVHRCASALAAPGSKRSPGWSDEADLR